MLTALIIIAFVFPVVYVIRRFILKEQGDVRPVVGFAVVVAVVLAVLAGGGLLLLGGRDTGAISTACVGTGIVAFFLMRR